MRCGQAGHFARDCLKGGDKKRKAEDDEITMVEEFTNEEQSEPNDEDTAVMDSGAASVLGSRSRIYDYIKCLEKKRVNVDEDVEVFSDVPRVFDTETARGKFRSTAVCCRCLSAGRSAGSLLDRK